jgi:hypothetical protein
MVHFPIPDGRRSKRSTTRTKVKLVINTKGDKTILPCLIVDRSQEGFRLRGDFSLTRGQLIEIILDDKPLQPVCCKVIWVGEAGSPQAGEAGVLVRSDN